MLDPTVQLVKFIPGGGGGGHHLSPTRVLTPDGVRVCTWIKTLPPDADGSKRQGAAAVTGYYRLGLNKLDVMDSQSYEHVMGGNNPPRFDPHTGLYFVFGEDDSDPGTVICTDQSLLIAKRTRP